MGVKKLRTNQVYRTKRVQGQAEGVSKKIRAIDERIHHQHPRRENEGIRQKLSRTQHPAFLFT